MQNVRLVFVLLLVHILVRLLVLFTIKHTSFDMSALCTNVHEPWFAIENGASLVLLLAQHFVILFVLLLVHVFVVLFVLILAVLLFVLLLVQNVVLLFALLLVQHYIRCTHNQISAQETFEVRQFLCLAFYLGRPWLCWGGGVVPVVGGGLRGCAWVWAATSARGGVVGWMRSGRRRSRQKL